MITGGVAVLIVALIVLAFIGVGSIDNNSASNTTSSSSTSSTGPTTTVAAAAEKPCVAMKGPLPKGAPNVPVTVGPAPTTLVTKDLKTGTGAVVTAGQTLSVDYIGVACSTGKIFDSSYSRGEPASFALSGVIPGWQQGIPGMKVGGERLLGIPASLAYGATGSPPDIGANEALWFVVTVHSAK
jgi:peptidylprolyl isomerase